MSEFADLAHNYATHAAQWPNPIIEQAARDFGFTEQTQKEQLGYWIAKGYMAGLDARQSEMMAQAAEQ